MTGSFFFDKLISFLAIVVLSSIIWAMFRGGPAPVDQARAQKRLAFDEPDFEPVHWLAGEGDAAMLAEGVGGDFALVTRLGDALVLRRFAAGGAQVEAVGDVLSVKARELAGPKARFKTSDAAQWAVKIAGKGAK